MAPDNNASSRADVFPKDLGTRYARHVKQRILQGRRGKAVMTRKRPLTIRTVLSGLAPAVIFLCAFVTLPLPLIAEATGTQSWEEESPSEESGENHETEFVVTASECRRLSRLSCHALDRCQRTVHHLHLASSGRKSIPAVIGHQLANGLCAPLLI